MSGSTTRRLGCATLHRMASESASPPSPYPELDPDRVVTTLHSLGVTYLYLSEGAETYQSLPPEHLIVALLQSDDVRVEFAIISLLLRHPEFADAIPNVASNLPSSWAETLQRHYTAAVYLQRMYRPALAIYLGMTPTLPDYFSAQLGLPSPDEYYGVIGLQELVDRLPPPIDWWGSYLYPAKMLIRFMSLAKTYEKKN